MKNLIFFLIFTPFLSFSQDLDGYTTIDDYDNSSNIEEYTHYEDTSNDPVSVKIQDQKNVNISSYDFIIIGRDTISRDKYIYLKNSGYFTWGRSTHQGTSNNVPFYHSSYSSESIYRNGIVKFLHIRFD